MPGPRALLRQRLGEADLAGLGGGIVGLAELALLAVDRRDVDDAAELALAHALDDVAAHVEQRAEVGVDHRGPLLRLHAVQRGVLGDAGVVDQHLDRTEIGLDLLDARRAGVERRHVPLVDVDAGFGLELLRRLVIAGVGRGDLVAGRLQRLRNRRTDAARPACHHCNASHSTSPKFSFQSPRQSQLKDGDGRDKPGHHTIVDAVRRSA